jgi:hypothetical protein
MMTGNGSSCATALQRGERWSEWCSGVPLQEQLCAMPGVFNPETWLMDQQPSSGTTLSDRTARCSQLSAAAADVAVAGDPGEGCWENPCSVMHDMVVVAQNLGIQGTEAITYVIMLGSSFLSAFLRVLAGAMCALQVVHMIVMYFHQWEDRVEQFGRKDTYGLTLEQT